MKKITLTCPFTGVSFDALETASGELIVQNVLTGETMRVGFNWPNNRYLLDRNQFAYIETVTSAEASQILSVSKSRISKIILNDVIPHFTINGTHMFRKADIMEYAETRKTGRPPKEE